MPFVEVTKEATSRKSGRSNGIAIVQFAAGGGVDEITARKKRIGIEFLQFAELGYDGRIDFSFKQRPLHIGGLHFA